MGKLESITTLASIAVGGLIFLKVYPLLEGFLKGGDAVGGITLPSFGVPPLIDQPVEQVFPTATPWTPQTDIILAEHAAQVAKVVDIVTPGVGERQITTTPEMFLQAGNIITELARTGAVPSVVPIVSPLQVVYPTAPQLEAAPTGLAYLLSMARTPGGVLNG